MPLNERATPLRLFRVDDRLLHGQVTLGWGRFLGPAQYVLVDDRLAADRDSAELCALAAPEGSGVRVLSEAQALALPAGFLRPEETILLVRGVAVAERLLCAGFPGPLNLGGVHTHPGARQILPYLFLTAEEEAGVGRLLRAGVRVFAQDLPQNPRHEASVWLDPSAREGADRGARAKSEPEKEREQAGDAEPEGAAS